MVRPKIKCLNLQLKFNHPEVCFWKPFLMIFLSLPSSEGTGLRLCPQTPPLSECRECREGAPLLLRVSVSVCCKKVGGRIHQRYKDRCYSGSWSSRHTGIDIETEEVISVNES